MAAILADPSWLPSPEGRPPESDRRQADVYRELMRRDPPGAWSSNRYLQSQQYVGTQYIAIKATWSWLAGSHVVVERERPEPIHKSHRVRKAASPGGMGRDDRYHPVESSDDLARLFKRINPTDTFQDFIAQLVIQIMLTGNGHIWLPRNPDGRRAEMWVLPSVMLQPMFGALMPQYPFGGYRLNPTYGMGWGGVGIPAVGNVPLDARDVVHYREPHPVMRWDGYGATQAMARQIDVLNGVETSRASSMAKGINPSAIVAVEGGTQTQCDDMAADINRGYAGVDKAGRVWVVGADKASVQLLQTTPKDMDFPTGHEQSTRVVSAGYRVPPVVAGLIEANYAEFWAAVRAWFAGELQPFALRLGAVLTKHVAEPDYGEDYRVRLQLPKIDDPDLQIQQHSFTPNDLYTVDEHRAAFDLPPVENGELVPSAYSAMQQQAAAPDPTQMGGDPNAAGADQDMSGHPLAALGDGILESLGIKGGGQPGQVGKAFGGQPGKYEESKHKRDHGKFSRSAGARGTNGKPTGNRPGASPARPQGQADPRAMQHPKVIAAVKRLASSAGTIAAGINAAALAKGLTPAAVVGDQTSWETWFTTQYSDVVAAHLGVDTQTAFAVLSHLIAHGIAAVKKHLGSSTPADPAAVSRSGPGRSQWGKRDKSRNRPADEPARGGQPAEPGQGVRPGAGAGRAARNAGGLDGAVDSVVFSDTKKKRTVIPLGTSDPPAD